QAVAGFECGAGPGRRGPCRESAVQDLSVTTGSADRQAPPDVGPNLLATLTNRRQVQRRQRGGGVAARSNQQVALRVSVAPEASQLPSRSPQARSEWAGHAHGG